MATQQGKLLAQQTGIYFENINNKKVDRILHNGSNFVTFDLGTDPLNPIMTYYNSDGTELSPYVMASNYVLDVAYENLGETGKYYQISKVDTPFVGYVSTFSESFEIQDPNFWQVVDYFGIIGSESNFFRYFYPGMQQDVFDSDSLIDYNNFGTLLNPSPMSDTASCGGYWFRPLLAGDYHIKLEAHCPLRGLKNGTFNLQIRDAGLYENFRHGISYCRFGSSDLVLKLYIVSSGMNNVTAKRTAITKLLVNTYTNEWPETTIRSYDIVCVSGGNELLVYYPGGRWTVNGGDLLEGYDYYDNFCSFSLTHDGLDIPLNPVSGESLHFTLFSECEEYSSVASGNLQIEISRNVGSPLTTFSGNVGPGGSFKDIGIDTGRNTDHVFSINTYFGETPGYPTVEGTSVYLDDMQIIGNTYVHSTKSAIRLSEIDSDGRVKNIKVNSLDILPNDGFIAGLYDTFDKALSDIYLAIDDNSGAFIKIVQDVYRVNLLASYSPGNEYDETSINIDVSSGIITETGIRSFQFNKSSDRFLQYIYENSITSGVGIRTVDITGSGAPTPSKREVFLIIPDWNEDPVILSGVASGVEYIPCLHGVDHTTLFYNRRAGYGEVNPVIVSGSNGGIVGTLFTAAGANFGTNLNKIVKPGDTIKLSGGTGITGVVKYTVVSVPSVTTLQLNNSTSIGTKSGLTYSIFSNAAQMQFNIDPNVAAFASINIDDFSLTAGTGARTDVHTEVINCWGEPLNGKRVTYEVVGDGSISDPYSTTSGRGLATTQYQVGLSAGQVLIKATITDDD